MTLFNLFEIVGVGLGLLYLYYEYRAHFYMWPVSVLMASIYIGIYAVMHVYGFMTMYGYYLIMSLYGWYYWQKTKEPSHSRQTEQTDQNDDSALKQHSKSYIHQVYFMPKKYWWIVISAIAVIFIIIYFLLTTFTNGEEILFDALINAIGVVALWMLTQKWVEQWLLLIGANILSIPLLLNIGLSFTMGLHIIYLVVSFLGYFKWRQEAIK